jgi:hypothetical protein
MSRWQNTLIAILVAIAALATAALVIVDLCDNGGKPLDAASSAAAAFRAR